MTTNQHLIRRRRPLAALGLALALGAAACSSGYGGDSSAPAASGGSGSGRDAPPAAEQTSTDGTACEILTPELAARVLASPGEPTSDRTTVDDTTVTNCGYASADGSSLSLLLRHQPGQGAAVGSAVESLRTITYEGVETEDVEGLGDAALFAPVSGGQLNVFDGDDFLVFTGGSLDQLQPLAADALA